MCFLFSYTCKIVLRLASEVIKYSYATTYSINNSTSPYAEEEEEGQTEVYIWRMLRRAHIISYAQYFKTYTDVIHFCNTNGNKDLIVYRLLCKTGALCVSNANPTCTIRRQEFDSIVSFGKLSLLKFRQLEKGRKGIEIFNFPFA